MQYVPKESFFFEEKNEISEGNASKKQKATNQNKQKSINKNKKPFTLKEFREIFSNSESTKDKLLGVESGLERSRTGCLWHRKDALSVW